MFHYWFNKLSAHYIILFVANVLANSYLCPADRSNISIHLESCLCPPDEWKSSIHSTFSSGLISTNPGSLAAQRSAASR